ncbi:histidinol dehydrogenase [Auritidibacter ignavus]|uniref:histidinol dehydrogenase n=1 Tax=Auritidibacter ignavus TaxID=678932 RepID=UPI00109D6F3C|nr:histidinol dehydrogenase [Auritidibacter ignavus]
MLNITDLRGRPFAPDRDLPRAEIDVTAAVEKITPILADVRQRGVAAVLAAGERFDGVRPDQLRVPASVIAQALIDLDPSVRVALEESIRRARMVHQSQLVEDTMVQLADGAHVENHWVPIQRVGLYVPGGRAVYPSSVVMNVVPAQAAGVESLAVATPPQREFNGQPHPVTLAACALLGVDEVYAAGGAQAIAMFAYGVREAERAEDNTAETGSAEPEWVCPPVDLITGPGNVYVAAAKRAVMGTVGIDAEAGPSEIAVIADETATPAWVAADLISQSEHDPMAASVLITHAESLAQEVNDQINQQVPGLPLEDQIREALTGPQSGILVVEDLPAAITVANAYATEHLEIHTADPEGVAEQITSAGAVFIGGYSPVPLGDYSAGSNHVLPTSGTARHSSGLNTLSFMRLQQRIRYSASGLSAVTPGIVALAESEGLRAHAEAVLARQLTPDAHHN